ncbi:Putative cysteine-rich repeat secretory protein 5, partial [Frankliniella fusca]
MEGSEEGRKFAHGGPVRLGTRLNLLESELKYAWRALDLLSHEYIRMWTRLEKLEALLYEQQNVIGQLLEFYSSVEAGDPAAHRLPLDNARRALQAIADARIGGFDKQKAIEAGEAAAAAGTAAIDTLVDEIYGLPGEAFYRSLNTAFREDLMHTENTPLQSSQLGMIWEEAEELEESKKDEGRDISSLIKELVDVPEVYSALDYKDYRGNSPCVSEHDLAQLSQLSAIDQNALEKLQELDRLTNKLQRDSASLKELKSRLLESPRKSRGTSSLISGRVVESEASNEAQGDSWAFSSSSRDDLLASATPSTSGFKSRTSSHLDVGSNDVDLTSSLASISGTASPGSTSPRHRSLLESSASAYGSSSKTTYSSALFHGDMTSSCSSLANKTANELYSSSTALTSALEPSNISSRLSEPIPSTKLTDGSSSTRLTDGLSLTRLSEGSSSSRLLEGLSSQRLGDNLPSSRYTEGLFSSSRERVCSPTSSIASVRTRKDGYVDSVRIDSDLSESLAGSFDASTSPPPPAPNDSDRLNRRSYEIPADDSAVIEMLIQEEQQKQEAERNTLSASLAQQPGRLSPHTPRSPKSPRLSPKHVSKSSSSNIIAAKSDSGLSSMSGWSSLEKSPGSPKSGTNKVSLHTYDNAYLELETQQLQLDAALASGPIITSPRRSPLPTYGEQASGILPGGHHISAFTTVTAGSSLDDSSRLPSIDLASLSMVPSPAPLVDVTGSPKSRSTYSTPTFYSAKGSTSSGAGYSDMPYSMDQSALYSIAGGSRQPSYSSLYASISKSPLVEYPDLIRPVSRSQIHSSSSYSAFKPEPEITHSTINSGFPTPTRSPLGSRERRTRLSRVHSTGSVPPTGLMSSVSGLPPGAAMPLGAVGGIANMEAYKTAMYRTMFPTGNITDALSYYPTNSSRNDRFLVSSYRDGQWMSRSIDGTGENLSYDPSMASISSNDTSTGTISYSSSHATSAARSDRINRYQPPPTTTPQRSQISASSSIEYPHRRPASEMDLRYRNVQEDYEGRSYRQPEEERFYNQSGVIVSQSGYLSIASHELREAHQPAEEKPPKKPRRTGSLKQAMSSVSQWLPDLKDLNVLSKRHRSNSLPSGVHTDDTKVSKDYMRYFTLNRSKNGDQASGSRKKKRHPLVSTMSGFIQRAKKRGPLLRHSLSDTETEPNEPEWSPPKAMRSQRSMGAASDSDDGAFEQGFERVVFDRVSARGSSMRQPKRDSISSLETRRIDDSDFTSDSRSQSRENQWTSHGNETNSRNREDSTDISSLFATVGDVKKTSQNGSGGEGETGPWQENIQLPPITIPAANREFAASRALGKYRQRQSSNSVSEAMSEGSDEKTDEGPSPRTSRHVDNDIVPKISEDDSAMFEEKEKKIIEEPTIILPQPSLGPLPVIQSETPPSMDAQMQAPGIFQAPSPMPSTLTSPAPSPQPEVMEKPEGSPSPSMHRGQAGNRHYLSRHQQSLEIPSLGRGGGSLEDDDNRSTHSWRSTSRVSSRRQSTEDSIDSEDEWYWYELRKLEEMERQSHLDHTDRDEALPILATQYEQEDEMKQQMSIVLQELRLKVKPTPDIQEVSQCATVIQPEILLPEVKEEPDSQPDRVDDIRSPSERLGERADEEHSSGETSGPDSPQQTDIEDDSDAAAAEEEVARSRRSSSGSTLRQQHMQGSDSLSRDGSISVGPSERSMSVQGDSEETATLREGSRSTSVGHSEEGDRRGSTATTTSANAKMRFGESDSFSSSKEEGSKWKLLKALKERKAEEKTMQEEKAAAAAAGKENGSGGDNNRSSGHPGANAFYSNIDSMPDIRPRRKSIPLVSELV